MHKIISTFLVLVAVSFSVSGHELTNTYGKVGPGEIEYEKCEFDSAANAVVMFDSGSTSFFDDENGSFNILFERKTRIKILSDGGIKWGEIAVPFYASNNTTEKVYDVDATSYNFEHGQITKSSLKLSNCHTEKLNNNCLLYKFAIPNVKKGTIIEYTYKIESPYLFNLRNWEFQWEIPVLASQYMVKMVPFYQYSYILQGAKSFDYYNSETDPNDYVYGPLTFKYNVHTFAMYDISAFNDEKFITSKNDNILKLDFQLCKVIYPDGRKVDVVTTWPKLIDEMLTADNVGKYIQKSKSLARTLINPVGLATLNEQQKFDSVINYVKQNFKWDEKFGKYASKAPKDFLTDKFGNSSDINLFAIGLLNAVGIEAYPLLMSTRGHGKIKYDYPLLDFFDNNLIIARLAGNYVLSDATDIMLANNRIPADCINGQGLILHKKGSEWIKLQTKEPTTFRTNIVQDLTNKFDNTSFVMNVNEYAAKSMRKYLGTDIKSIQKRLIEAHYQVQDSNILVANQYDFKSPYSLSIKFHKNFDFINNKIYVSPFLSEVIKDNPLKQKKRTYPIDMIYPELRSYVSTIKIPAGYKIDYMPVASSINNDKFELKYFATVSDNEINVTLNYYFKQSEYAAGDYEYIKSYFNEIVNKGSEKVVLVKQ